MARRNSKSTHDKKPDQTTPTTTDTEQAEPAVFYTDVLVNGDVQCRGVRRSIVEVAEKLHCTGVAINRPDGSVEVRAFGTKEALDKLHEHLEVAPRDNINLTSHLFMTEVPSTVDIPQRFSQAGSHY